MASDRAPSQLKAHGVEAHSPVPGTARQDQHDHQLFPSAQSWRRHLRGLQGTVWLPPTSRHAPDGVGPVLPVGTDSRTSLVLETSPPEMARRHGSPRKAGRSGGPASRPTGDAQQRPQPGTYRRLCAHHLRAACGSHAVCGQVLLGANAALLPTRQAMARPNSSPQCPHAGSLWR